MGRRRFEELTEEEIKSIRTHYITNKCGVDGTCRATELPYGMVYKYLKTNNLLRGKKEAYNILSKNMNEEKYTNKSKRTMKG